MKKIRGYKVLLPDWTSNYGNFKYKLGKTYKGIKEEDISLCECGYHFCKKLADCFNYYDFNSNNIVVEVEASGKVIEGDNKCVTNKIKIVKQIGWEKVLTLCNSGDWNSGDRNSGDRNSGNRNSGNRNSGDWNSGDRNSGNRNSGNRNSGDWNSGDWNSGNRNSGNWNSGDRNSGDRNSGNKNSGDWNSGDWNSGDWNSGNWNSGDWNSGDWNSGDWNSGNRNSGNWNSGDRNSGDWNSGDRNSGNRNSGDWNSGDWNSGIFNTDKPKLRMFNKPSDWTYDDWLYSDARAILNNIPDDYLKWIYEEVMTDEEKTRHPEHKTTGGYLKLIEKADRQKWWDDLEEEHKKEVLKLPNFDRDIFKEITGIDVENSEVSDEE